MPGVFLRKGFGSWSSGTRVEIVSQWTEPGEVVGPQFKKKEDVELCDVQIQAGDKPILYGVLMTDLVKRK